MTAPHGNRIDMGKPADLYYPGGVHRPNDFPLPAAPQPRLKLIMESTMAKMATVSQIPTIIM
jgi:hypothetical protein